MRNLTSNAALAILLCTVMARSQSPMPKGPASVEFFPETTYQSQAVMDSLIRWEERMYLHMDRSAVAPGESIFFKAYAMTGPKRLGVSPSGVLKVNLTDPDGVRVSSQYYPLENGNAAGVVRIPKDLEANSYTLTAYTRWMQNYGESQYFKRTIHVSEVAGPISGGSGLSQVASIRFHPEGGKLLAGTNNKLIITAWDALGCPVRLQGEIRDAEGNRVVDVESYEEGLGMSLFQPESGKRYSLHLDNGSSYPLPEIQESGYILQVSTLDPEKVRITIAASGVSAGPVMLQGRASGEAFFTKDLDIRPEVPVQVDISKDNMPAGTLHFRLQDAQGEVLTERPLHVEGKEALEVSLIPIQQDFSIDGENVFRLQVSDAEGNPVQTEVSFSAVKDTSAPMAGIIAYVRPNPGTGDMGQFRRSVFLEDLKALTQDPRQQARAYPDEILYPIQKELELIGYAYDLNNELLKNTDIQVMSSTEENLFIQERTTDESGILKVTGMRFSGEIPLIFRTKGEDTRSSLVRFEPLHEEIMSRKATSPTTQVFKELRKAENIVETTPWTVIDTTGLISLAEATVTARKQEEKESPSVYGIKPRRTIKQDPNKPVNSIFELIQRIPGVFVSGDIYDRPQIRVPSQSDFRGSVRFVVDGLLLVSAQDPFNLIPPSSVDRIELLSTSDASIYGSRGSGAIFAIYTRDGSGGEYVRRKDAMVTFKGFENGLPFEQYLQERRKIRKLRKKAPATLYWNPDVQTDENGEALVQFKSPGDYDRVRITAETLTPEGRPGAVQLVFEGVEGAVPEQ